MDDGVSEAAQRSGCDEEKAGAATDPMSVDAVAGNGDDGDGDAVAVAVQRQAETDRVNADAVRIPGDGVLSDYGSNQWRDQNPGYVSSEWTQNSVYEPQRRTASATPDEADTELQTAIAISLLESKQKEKIDEAKAAGCPEDVAFAEDADLQRVLQESVLETQKSATRNTLRDHDIPVGLQNVGNSCYFNSIIQALFHVPTFRAFVLSVDLSSFGELMEVVGDSNAASLSSSKELVCLESEEELAKHHTPEGVQRILKARADAVGSQGSKESENTERISSVKFLYELQRLFLYMLESVKTHVDPADLVSAARFDQGHARMQQDVGEFCFFFVNKLLEGIKRIEGVASAAAKTAQALFIGEYEQVLQGRSEDEFQMSRKEEFNQIILSVTPGCQDMMSSLEEWAYPAEGVAYRLDSGEETVVRSETAFISLPQVLMFTLQRTQYDTKRQEAVKNTLQFDFPESAYLGRFTAGNLLDVRIRRERVRQWKEELVVLEKRQKEKESYGNGPLSLVKILDHTISYLRISHSDSVDHLNAADVIDLVRDRVRTELEEISSAAEMLREKISSAFADIKSNPFVLQSVLIHDGVLPGSGHYWVYSRVPGDSQWWKLNDVSVMRVDWAEVVEHAMGGSKAGAGSCAAYGLVYVAEDACTSVTKNVSRALSDEVSWDNRLFTASMTPGDIVALAFVRVVKEYVRIVTDLKRSTEVRDGLTDPAALDFDSFLWIAEEGDFLKRRFVSRALKKVSAAFPLDEVSSAELNRLVATRFSFSVDQEDVDREKNEVLLKSYNDYNLVLSHISHGLLWSRDRTGLSEALILFGNAARLNRSLHNPVLQQRYEMSIEYAVEQLIGLSLRESRFGRLSYQLALFEVIVQAGVMTFQDQPPIWDKVCTSVLEFVQDASVVHMQDQYSDRLLCLVEMATTFTIMRDVPMAAFKAHVYGKVTIDQGMTSKYALYEFAMNQLRSRTWQDTEALRWRPNFPVVNLDDRLLTKALKATASIDISHDGKVEPQVPSVVEDGAQVVHE